MNKFLLTFLVCVAGASPAMSQLNGNGFYRVQNYMTDRYAYITDNKGHVDVATTSVDALAIQLWKDFNKACCDPATVLYFESKGGVDYDIVAQGTGVYNIIEHNVSIRTNSDGTYMAYGKQDKLAKYLGDANSSDSPEGTMSSEAQGKYRNWWIKPITSDGDNYFGIKPTVTAQGKHYRPMYASFPMSAKSSGVVIHVVTKYGYGMAVSETVSGTIPGNTPCYIECSTTSPSNNRMNVGGSGAQVNNNQMGGVFFENYMKTHLNLTPYDPNTMRVLGVLSDGSLGFVIGDIENLPANQSYLKVPAGSPAEIRIVTNEEYDRVVSGHPTSVSLNAAEATLYVGGQTQLLATIAPENATDKHLSWTSSNSSIATVDSNGLVKALGKGTAVITVSTINGKTAQCTVTVNPVYPESIAVSPATYKFYVGDEYQLTATITPTDVQDKTVSWSSSDASVVTVDNTGLIKAVKVGSATVTAKTADGKTASSVITVNPVYPSTVTLNSSERYIHAKEAYQLVATITPSDVKDSSLEWSSADENIAVVDPYGKVVGRAVGSTVITVKSPGGASATCVFNIMAQMPEAVSLNFDKLIMEVDDTRYLTASVSPSDSYSSITWSSSDTNVITVSSLGQVKAVGEGEAEVIVTTANGLEASCSVTVLAKGVPATSVKVLPSSLSLVAGTTRALSVEILPEDVTNRFVTWTSNNTKVATVDSEGNVTAVANGVCIIYAQCGSVSGTCTVTVTGAEQAVPVTRILLNRYTVIAEEGTEFTLVPTVIPTNATDKRVSWTSDNEDVAVVSETGTVTIKTVGNAIITAEAMDGNGASGWCAVTGIADISDIAADSDETVTVYTLDGILLFQAATPDDIRSLAPGFYVIGNRKVLVK